MSAILVENPWTAGVVYTLALGAIYKGSQRSLTKHIKRHQPPDEDDNEVKASEETKLIDEKKDDETNITTTSSEAEAQPETDEPKPKSRWEKWKDGLIFFALVAAMWGVGILLGFGLPKIATPAILDMVWMVLVGYQVVIVYKEFINNILPDPRSFEVRWSGWNAITWTETASVPSGPVSTTRKRWAAVAFLTLGTLGGVYTGSQWIIALPIGALVYNFVSSTMVPDRSVQSTLKWLGIIQLGVVGAAGIVLGGVKLYQSIWPSAPKEVKGPKSQPSPEVLLLMMMFSSTVPLVVSGYFIGLGLRFDYTQALKAGFITEPPKIAESTKFVKLPSFPKPFFQAGLQTLFIQLIIVSIAQCSATKWFKETAQILYAVCLPATIVAGRMLVLARGMGVGQEFGGYTEMSLKSLKKKREEEKKSVEQKGDSLLVLDEKRPVE